MPGTYDIYFHGARGEILGHDAFPGEDDRAAMVIAQMLYRSCADLCDGFELWQGHRRVDPGFGGRIHLRSGELTAERQSLLAACEERLRDSRWAIAGSTRLQQQLDRLLGKLNRPIPLPEQERHQRLARTLSSAVAKAREPKDAAPKPVMLRLATPPKNSPGDKKQSG